MTPNLITINADAKPDQIARLLTSELPPENLDTVISLCQQERLRRRLRRLAIATHR